MKIRRVSWENYRRLSDGHVEVHDNLVLVGPNDSGKSSVLWAIHLCLGVPGSQLASSLHPRDLSSEEEPLVLEVVLVDFSDDERAAFPDEIDVGPPETLTIRLEGTIDPDDPAAVQVERRFPLAGHTRGLGRVQLDAIGWSYVSATRSLFRELGGTSAGVARDLLWGLDLSADEEAFEAARETYRTALEESTALGELRSTLADALSAALPKNITNEDVGVRSAADLLNNPLAGASVTLRDGDEVAPLAEQSDGIRALSVLALLGLSQQNARIVGIDEPETYLHTTAQRAIAASLQMGGGQRVICTHSSAVVGQMSPLDVAAFGADRSVRQLPPGAPFVEGEVLARHWAPRMIEPLTSRSIILVEGVSDRIILTRVAALLSINLDRVGISVFELDGSGLFGTANELFGPPGFNLPLFGLVDDDAAQNWADELGVTRGGLADAGIVECLPDLEGVYVDALGAQRVATALVVCGAFTEHHILADCGVATLAEVTNELIADFCRHKKRKTRAAIVIAQEMTVAEAQAIAPIAQLLTLVAT